MLWLPELLFRLTRARHSGLTAGACVSVPVQGPAAEDSALSSPLFQFFACLVMIAYGASAFFSFQAWRGVGSNAATSQMAGGYA